MLRFIHVKPLTEVGMADFLDEKRSEIAARLKELEPLVREYKRLEAAAAALDGVPAAQSAPGGSSPVAGASRRRPSSTPTRRASGRAQGTGRRGRPKGSGTRGAEALAIVKRRPGVTIPQIAEEMGIKQNYLYRVLPGLAEDGLVAKDGRGWHPRGSA